VFFPITFEFRARLLVDLLFYIEVTLIQHCYVVSQHSYFDLRSLSCKKRRFPSLNKKSSYHNVVTWLHQVDQVVLKNHHHTARYHARLKSLVDFLNFDFLIVLVLSGTMHRHKETIVAAAHHHIVTRSLFTITLWFFPTFHVLYIRLERVWSFFNLAATYGRQLKT